MWTPRHGNLSMDGAEVLTEKHDAEPHIDDPREDVSSPRDQESYVEPTTASTVRRVGLGRSAGLGKAWPKSGRLP